MTHRYSLVHHGELTNEQLTTDSRADEKAELLNREFEEITFDAWIAPRSFGGTGNLESLVEKKYRDETQQKGFAFGIASFGQWAFQAGTGDSWEEVWVNDDPLLPENEWSHLTAVFNGNSGVMRLYLDGERVTETSIESGATVKPADTDLLIGVNKDTARAGPYPMEMLNATVSSVDIYDGALDDDTVAHVHEVALDAHGGNKPAIDYHDLTIPPSHWDSDEHRPQYHVIPPSHWMNEPHAPLYYNGKYHLFYQRNPKGPYWHHIHWGHWVSEDLVHWRTQPNALSPEQGLDPDGCWSGDTTYDQDGQPVIFYTAGNSDQTPNQSVVKAEPVNPDDPNLVDWEKHPTPVITHPGDQELLPNDFRDPFVWQENDKWFALVTAGLRDNGGTALVFRSNNLDDWTYEGPLFRSNYDKYPYLGTVWELPVLLPVSTDDGSTEKHAFFINPAGKDADVDVYYWVGEWNPIEAEFTPDHEKPRLLDCGDSHFTGPSGMVDPKTGRSLLFTIAQDYRPPIEKYNTGWAHNGGLPVSLHLRDNNRLGLEPIEELQSLRTQQLLSVEDAAPDAVNSKLKKISGDTVEIRAELESVDATKYGLKVRRSMDGTEETLLYYDEGANQIVADRENSTLDSTIIHNISQRSRLVHQGSVNLDGEYLSLTLYIDKSMIECYVNQKKSLTTRAYPTRDDADSLRLFHDGDIVVRSMEVWELASSHATD